MIIDVLENPDSLEPPDEFLRRHGYVLREGAEAQETHALLRYRQLVENSSDLISEVDPDGRFLFVNSRHYDLLGYRSEELIGTASSALLHPDDLQTAIKAYDSVQSLAVPSSHVWRFRHKDGSYRSFECRSKPSEGRDGMTTVVISHDITDRLEVESALAESEARFQAFMDHLPAAVFIKDRTERLLFCNRLYAAAVNCTPEELLGKTGSDSIPAELQEQYATENRRVFEAGEIITEESRLDFEGETRHWFTCKFPIKSGTRTLMGAFSFDVSDQKRIQADLERMVDEKVNLMREMHHRVKNNLLMVTALLRLKEGESGIDLADIRRQIDAIRLVHEKLHHSADSGHLDTGEYVDGLLNNLLRFYPQFRVTIEKDIKPCRFGSKTAVTLGLIINELATNAFKHGFEVGPEYTLSLLLERVDEHCYSMKLGNTGNPIPEEVSLENPNSLGLRLIGVLSRQLKGDMRLERRPHPMFSLTFEDIG